MYVTKGPIIWTLMLSSASTAANNDGWKSKWGHTFQNLSVAEFS